jgi:hypothetical protein
MFANSQFCINFAAQNTGIEIELNKNIKYGES